MSFPLPITPENVGIMVALDLIQGGGAPANALTLRDGSTIILRDNSPLLGRAA